jgi:hypothetical protein
MATRHIFLFAGGLSFVPLLFVSGGLGANVPFAAAPTVTETSRLGSSVTSATTSPPVTAASIEPPVVASSAAPPTTATSTADSNPAGRISAEPITGPATAGTPPQPSPLAPLSAPSTSGAPEPALSAEGLIDAEAKAAVAGAALAPAPSRPRAANMSMPATPPPDVINDAAPVTESFFDRQDDLNGHPVHSAAPITSSWFDKEDRADEHPVP